MQINKIIRSSVEADVSALVGCSVIRINLLKVIKCPSGRRICMSYIPNTPEDQQAMLERLGLSSLEALLAPVPENVRLRRPLNLPPALAEPDLKRLLNSMAAKK